LNEQTQELSDENVQFEIIDAVSNNQEVVLEYQTLLKSYKLTNRTSSCKKQSELKEQNRIPC
jgi:DNA repair protein RecN (Recombination protein N)